ncbi:MAG: PcfJ domain-containing protein [Cyanobacteria bacterium SZAS LIN-2]|nr:PcfJ domain-containing protein [Cyanobacteria bacterium SZAS LIN-2]
MTKQVWFTSMRDVMKQAFQQLHERYERNGNPFVLPTGFPELDDIIGGFRWGTLTVVAGRPSSGKTSLLLNIVEHLALHENACIAVCSTELAYREYGIRHIASVGDLGYPALCAGRIEEEHWPKITRALTSLCEARVFLNSSPTLDIDALCAGITQICRDQGCDLVIVDSLQQVRWSQTGGERRDAMRTLTARLKQLACDLNVALVVTCGLPPFVDARANKIPVLADMGDWQSFEDYADTVMLMYNPNYYNAGAVNEPFEVRVCMNRTGLRGIAQLPFNYSVPKFQTTPREDYAWDAGFRWLAPQDGEKYGALVLANEAELRTEGDAMGNCVASYAPRCARGGCRILSIRKGRHSTPVANAMIEPTADGHWKATQVLARRNARASRNAIAVAHRSAALYGVTQTEGAKPTGSGDDAGAGLANRSRPACT